MEPVTRLALEARDGDERSLDGFVRSTQADVWRLACHLVDRDSADDVTQEVYLRAIPALARYRGDAPARAWLLSITRRTCADVLRRRDRRRRLRQRLESRPIAEQPAVVGSRAGEVDLALLIDHLDPDRRAAFVLTQVLGLPYAEAALACDVPIGTIRSRVARARGDLIAAGEADEEPVGL